MDYFTALNIFHSVAETGSFTKTAQALDMAVSSVTRQIDNLEQSLKVDLLTRSTRRIALTQAGVLYLEKTLPIVDELREANLALLSETGEPQGKLKISFFPALVPMITPILTAFAKQYPKISLEVLVSDDYVDFQADRVDVAVRIGRVDNPNVVAKVLRKQRRLLCASPNYLLAQGMPDKPDDLLAHNCFAYHANRQVHHWFFAQSGKKGRSVAVKGSLIANSVELLKSYVLAGLGIAHLPEWVIAQELADGRLLNVLPDWQIKPTADHDDDALYLLYPSNSRHITKISLMMNALLAQLGE